MRNPPLGHFINPACYVLVAFFVVTVPLGWSSLWPTARLDFGNRVEAEFDDNGDLVDLNVDSESWSSEKDSGDEVLALLESFGEVR